MAEPLGDMLRRKAREKGGELALVCGGRETSFAALDRKSDLAARALLADGLKPGDRVAFLGKNSDRYFELLFAAAKAGMVTVPIGWRLTEPEIAFLLEDCGAAVLFVEPGFAALARRLIEGRPLRLVSMGEPLEGAPGYQDWRARGAEFAGELPAVDPGAPALQLYTSGTTGRPKGAMLSHANIFALNAASQQTDWNRWDEGDASLVTMPVAHIAGTGWGLVGLQNGAKSIILPEFDPAEVIRVVSTEPVAKLFLVPAALNMVLRHPAVGTADFSRLRHLLYGASPIPLDLLREAVGVFGCGFVQCYGMTETTGTVVALAPEDHSLEGNPRMRSAGRALPGCEVKVVGPDDAPLPPGTTGEILVRSPSNMLGYHGRQEATQEALRDGWMRTGDAGYLDEEGYVFIQDRLKDTIITGGENVYPAEVESVLFGHPAVADVAVIGVPDARWGEAVNAVVVPKGGADVDVPALLAWARERLAGYKVPKAVHLAQALPRNPSGKVLRRELREPFWAGRERAVN